MPLARTKEDSSSAALTAVAFQDHLVRGLDLSRLSLSHHRIPSTKQPAGKMAKHKRNLRCAKAVVDTGRRVPMQDFSSCEMEAEYVLDPEPKPLSLAQKFGLVATPAKPLSDGDWKEVKVKSNQREDSALPCVICKETFGLQAQVLLSCSHVFHKNCLAAFERFTGRKTCPMCRQQQYQTRVIYEGAKICRHKSATRIQAAWRGHVVRKWYRTLRETVPPNEPLLRKKYYEEKLTSITERMVKSYSSGVDDFLQEIDQSVTASRAVFRNLESSKLRMVSEDEWEHIYQKVQARENSDCPICIMPLARDSQNFENVEEQAFQRAETHKSLERFVLLSCSHLFHRTCLEAFEELSLLEEKVCPVCRSNYQKRYL